MLVNLKALMYIELLLVAGTLLFRMCLQPSLRRLVSPGDVALILLLPVVGVFGTYKAVYYGFLFVIPLCSGGDARRLACIYALFLSLFPALGEPFTIGSVYLGNLSGVMVLNLGALTALAMVRGKRSPGALPDIAAWFFFVILAMIDARGNAVTAALRPVLESFLNVIPPYYVFTRAIRSRETARDATLAFLFGGVLNAVIAIYEAKQHWPLYETFRRTLHLGPTLSLSVSVRAGFMRAAGAVMDPTALGLLLALSLVAWLVVAKHLSQSGRWIILAVLLGALFAAQSRGAWVSAAIGVALYFIYHGQRLRVFVVGFAGLLAAAVVLALPTDGYLGELLGRSGEGRATADYRSQLLDRGLEEIARHPFTGQSRETLQVTMNDLRQGQHIIDFVNTPLAVTLVLGGVGLLLWLLVWLVPMSSAWRAQARAARAGIPVRDWVALGGAMMGTMFVGLIFTSMVDRAATWIAMGMGLIATFAAMLGREVRDRRRGASPEFGSVRELRADPPPSALQPAG